MSEQSALSVYAVIRLETRLDDLQALEGNSNAPQASSTVTIKKVVASAEVARQEVNRLNDLNRSENCRYYWQHTRLYPDDFEQIALRVERNKA
jgi:hypothetical protein